MNTNDIPNSSYTREQAKSLLENQKNSSENNTKATTEPNIHYTNAQVWDAQIVLILAFGVLIFVLTSLTMCTYILIKQKAKTSYTLRIFGIITILGLSTFLVIVGYSIEQINGVTALFSAIAGYLLGKSDTSSLKKEEAPPSSQSDDPRSSPLE